MKVAFFSTQSYEKVFFEEANTRYQHQLDYRDVHLNTSTAFLCAGYEAVCCFVNDKLDASCLQLLKAQGIRLIALRSAGYNHVDIAKATELGITVTRVPAYSPFAVAEHAVGLVLALNRKIHRAYNRVRENDFSLHGLMGFDLHGRTVGVIGVGRIGSVFATIMKGFGCNVLVNDIYQDPAYAGLGLSYVDLDMLYERSDIISLHCPLTPDTHHMINEDAIKRMKSGVMLINTSRGGLVDTHAVIAGLKQRHIGYLGLDVYEEEADLFFSDLSDRVIQDDVFARLQTFPNVIITGHQAFFTEEAVSNIADTTLSNITAFASGQGDAHIVV